MLDTSLLELWPLVVAGGFVVGFLVGMTGVGAGSLMTPFLISQVGVAPSLAVGTDLLFAGLTKASAAARHHSFGNVSWPIVRWLALGSVPGALFMLLLLGYLKPDVEAISRVIKGSLAVTLVFSSFAIVLYPLLARGRLQLAASDADPPVRALPTLLLGFTIGTMVTLTSVGAGAIGVVVLSALYSRLITRRLVGTDIVHAIPLTLISGAGHASMGNANLLLLAMLLAGSIPGIALGARLTGKLPDWMLRVVLAVVLMIAAYQLYQKI
ncbi:MAG TPA: sulfite exporter TauE/SafE family protein [Hyphomicrobium sp.]|nr:sulfite exporter TauE/SafE family protein [Hyphomicrobium sp.]